jgi:hypothetical protein
VRLKSWIAYDHIPNTVALRPRMVLNMNLVLGRERRMKRILIGPFSVTSWLHIFIMSHHLFLLSPTDTPLYSLTHYSTKGGTSVVSPLSSNLPSWTTSAFAGTLTALTGGNRTSRTGGGQDRHVMQMIGNASLDVIEEVMRRESGM